MHEVIRAAYIEDYKILVEFDDSKSKIIDFKKALKDFKGQIFQPLKDIDYFKTFKISEGIATLSWDNGADISPEFLYQY